MMEEKLFDFIEKLKGNPSISSLDEASTKQAVILPLLNFLGWDTYNVDEVKPEFSVEGKRVDYSLRVDRENYVFIEVKKIGIDLENHQEQLLEYSFRLGVSISVLTNGLAWWFYLPRKKGSWKNRKIYTIDLFQQELDDVCDKFINLLSKSQVNSGEAIKYGESLYKGKLRKETLSESLPEAWNKIINDSDSILLDLLSETTEGLCGYRPDAQEAKQFIKNHEHKLIIGNEPEPVPKAERKRHEPKTQLPSRQKHGNGEILPNISGPLALVQTLEVIYLVHKQHMTRSEATNYVANIRSIAPQTVIDKYCRQLGQSADDINRLLEPSHLKEFSSLLEQKYFDYQSIIKDFFSKLRI